MRSKSSRQLLRTEACGLCSSIPAITSGSARNSSLSGSPNACSRALRTCFRPFRRKRLGGHDLGRHQLAAPASKNAVSNPRLAVRAPDRTAPSGRRRSPSPAKRAAASALRYRSKGRAHARSGRFPSRRGRVRSRLPRPPRSLATLAGGLLSRRVRSPAASLRAAAIIRVAFGGTRCFARSQPRPAPRSACWRAAAASASSLLASSCRWATIFRTGRKKQPGQDPDENQDIDGLERQRPPVESAWPQRMNGLANSRSSAITRQ